MREQLYSWLSTDPYISSKVGTRIYPVNMEDQTPRRPFIVYRLGVATPRVVPAQNDTSQIWVHDDRGDYTEIDNLIQAIKELLEGKYAEGRLFGISWLDDSEDLYDDGSNTIARYTRHQWTRLRSEPNAPSEV